MRTHAVPTVLVAALLSSCAAVGPNYQRPTAPTPGAYKTLEGWTPAQPADLSDRGDWWTLFGDPVLDDLAGKVNVSNQTVIGAEAAYRQARALVRAQRSQLFPTVSVTGGASHTGVLRGSDSGQYNVGIGGSWEPDIWGRIRRGIEAAGDQAQASQADLAAATLSIQGELASDYLGLRATDQQIQLLQATVDAYQRSLTIAQNRYDAGAAPRSDVLQAQTQLSTTQASLEGARRDRANLENAIAVLVGQPAGDFRLAPGAWSRTAPTVPPGVPSTLLQRRPDIAAAERRTAAANAEIGVAQSAYYPDINLSGSLSQAASQIGKLFSTAATVWSLGITAAQTIFDGGARKAQVEAARAAYDQTVANYRQTVLTAFQDVENQLVAAQVLERQQALYQQASTAADQTEQMILNQYKAGQVSYTDVAIAQASALGARRSLVQSISDRQVAAVALIQALGGGWSAPADFGSAKGSGSR